MATALNMTMRLKQDPASQAKLAAMAAMFTDHIQAHIDKALRGSTIVHYARILVIDNKYIQVITEFDGDKQVYTDFFRVALPDVFKAIFELVEDAPPWDELNDRDAFYAFTKDKNVRALGTDPADPKEGYLFAAYNDVTVKEILQKVGAGV